MAVVAGGDEEVADFLPARLSPSSEYKFVVASFGKMVDPSERRSVASTFLLNQLRGRPAAKALGCASWRLGRGGTLARSLPSPTATTTLLLISPTSSASLLSPIQSDDPTPRSVPLDPADSPLPHLLSIAAAVRSYPRSDDSHFSMMLISCLYIFSARESCFEFPNCYVKSGKQF